MRKDFFDKIKAQQVVDEFSMQIICSAKNQFWGAPEKLDESVSFPKFFLFRQFPKVCKLLKWLNVI